MWNYGFAYGRSRPRLAGKRLLWLALMGGTPEEIERLGMTDALGLMLVTGISEFCGLPDATLRVLHGTELSGVSVELRAGRVADLLTEAEQALAEELPATATATATTTAATTTTENTVNEESAR